METPPFLQELYTKSRSFLTRAFSRFRAFETKLDRLPLRERMFVIGFGVLLIATLVFGIVPRYRDGVRVPAQGGAINEGIVGTPRFINPVLATSDVDRDTAMLVFSGLLRNNLDGTYIPDLAATSSVSQNGLTHTITLKENLTFHDGTPLTASDVVFTINLLKNPIVRSPRLPEWQGVEAEASDEQTVVITLPRTRSNFEDALTVGILPEELWRDVSAEEFAFSTLNVRPIGSGPFKTSEINFSDSGLPTSIVLERFDDFALTPPYLDEIRLRFYATEEGLRDSFGGRVDSWARIPTEHSEKATEEGQLIAFPLSRAFGIFINFDHASSTLLARANRTTLDDSLDRGSLVDETLSSLAFPLKTLADFPWLATSTDAEWIQDENEDILDESERSSFSFTLTTVNTRELIGVAEFLKEAWAQSGAEATLRPVSFEEMSDIIASRDFEALLYGISLEEPRDLGAYFYSTEAASPGLNISGYTNPAADRAIGRIVSENSPESADALASLITESKPFIPLYAPHLLYALPENIKGVTIGRVTEGSTRFARVYEWYSKTKRI